MEKTAEQIILDGYMAGYMQKRAFLIPSTGGGTVVTNQGVGLTAGYDYLGGVIPVPDIGIRFGNKDWGFSLSGPIPGIGIDDGIPSRKWMWNNKPNLYQYFKDKANDTPEAKKARDKKLAKAFRDFNKLKKSLKKQSKPKQIINK